MLNLKLVTSDELPIVIDYETMKCSYLIRDIVESLSPTEETIPLANIDYSTMQLILKWAAQHKDDPPVPANYDDAEMDTCDIPEWDKKLLTITQDKLVDLIKAADYLHIPKLSEYCSKAIALLITGKTVEEMRQILGVIESEEEVDSEDDVNNKEELDSSDEVEDSSDEEVEYIDDINNKDIFNEVELRSYFSSSDEETPSKKRKIEASTVPRNSSHRKRNTRTTKRSISKL